MQTFDSTSSDGRRQIIEAYRVAVMSSPDRLSFKCFCDNNGISNYKAILWWRRDRQINLKRIQEHPKSPSLMPQEGSIVQIRPVCGKSRPSSSLSNISITFPDGVNLSLQ
jgi:hypothetical protein